MDNIYKLILSKTLANLYNAITEPWPVGVDLLTHAGNCAECDNRMHEAKNDHMKNLSFRKKIELELGVRWIKHQLEGRGKKVIPSRKFLT